MVVFRSRFPDLCIPEDVSVTEYVMEHFAERADLIALIDATTDRSITYCELRELIYGVAKGLHARGLSKGDVLAICASNCPEYIVMFHATAMIGGIVTTINPLYSTDELVHHIKLMSPSFLVVGAAFIDKVQEALKTHAGLRHLIVLGTHEERSGLIPFEALIERGAAEVPRVRLDTKSDLVAVPFSSGTTGLPKGVMISHYNMIAAVCQKEVIEANLPGDVFSGFLPFFHIFGLTTLMNLTLRVGAAIVIMPKFDLLQYLNLIVKHRITTAHIAPPVALALAKHPAVEQSDLSSLRFVYVGAAPLDRNTQQALIQRLPHIVLKQGYGMTESFTTHTPPDRLARYFPGSVGGLLPNIVCKIIDPDTRMELGVEQDGEILVKGPQVTLGYYKDPEATANTIDKEGFLRTGDAGYVDRRGMLYIVDRFKELVKYKGFQVPPAELEGLLLTHPFILDAAVVGRPDLEAGELPTAFVVLQPGSKLSEDEVIEYIAGKTAPHKRLRGGVHFIDQIPKSPSGKILRRVLRALLASDKLTAKL